MINTWKVIPTHHVVVGVPSGHGSMTSPVNHIFLTYMYTEGACGHPRDGLMNVTPVMIYFDHARWHDPSSGSHYQASELVENGPNCVSVSVFTNVKWREPTKYREKTLAISNLKKSCLIGSHHCACWWLALLDARIQWRPCSGTLYIEGYGPVSVSDKTYNRRISWNFVAARLIIQINVSLWNLIDVWRDACRISERLNNSEHQSCGLDTLWDIRIRRLGGYWNVSLRVMVW